MKLKIFGMTILTGKDADSIKEVQERIVELGESLEGVGKLSNQAIILAHAKAQLDYKSKMRQEIYASVEQVVLSGGLVKPGATLERVVEQALDELCDLRNWKASRAGENESLSQKLDDMKKMFEGAVENGMHYENLDKQKSLALRLVLHVLRNYVGKQSEVGSVLTEARKAVVGGELLLRHERGHPALLAATKEDRQAWVGATEIKTILKAGSTSSVFHDRVTGTTWDRVRFGVMDHTPPPGGISREHQAMADHLNMVSLGMSGAVNYALEKEQRPGGILHSMRNQCR